MNPIRIGARPVLDFVSSATIRMTVTRTNVAIASMKIPLKQKIQIDLCRFHFQIHTCQILNPVTKLDVPLATVY